MFNDTTTVSPRARKLGAMNLLVTGGSGVLGRALRPIAEAVGHRWNAPTPDELDLFDPDAIARAVRDADAVLHLATRIRSLDLLDQPEAWHDNDRLRADATRILVDAALVARVAAFVVPTVTFVYPGGEAADEDSPTVDGPIVHSALIAEHEVARFGRGLGRGVVLRLGLLDGPGTGNDSPNARFGATIHACDAGRALLAALSLPTGIYNVCRDGERVSNRRFCITSGWKPRF